MAMSGRAQASTAAPAAALAAATSPANVAKLCCTAWNLPIGLPNWDRSSACWTDCSRILSSAPASCCNRTAAPKPTSRSSSNASGCTAAGMAPSNDTSSLGSPARLLDWLTAKPAAATSATAVSLPRGTRTAMWPALRANGTRRARPVRVPSAQRDVAISMNRRHGHRPVRHRDTGAGEEPAGHQALGERNRSRKTASDAQYREAISHPRPGATKIVGNPRQRQPRLLERVPQGLRPHALLGVVDRGGLAQIPEDSGRGIDDDVVGGIVHLATASVVPAGSDRRAGEGGREAPAAI